MLESEGGSEKPWNATAHCGVRIGTSKLLPKLNHPSSPTLYSPLDSFRIVGLSWPQLPLQVSNETLAQCSGLRSFLLQALAMATYKRVDGVAVVTGAGSGMKSTIRNPWSLTWELRAFKLS